MKRLQQTLKRVSPVIASLAMFFAVYGGIKPACIWGVYQPKAPKCLKE